MQYSDPLDIALQRARRLKLGDTVVSELESAMVDTLVWLSDGAPGAGRFATLPTGAFGSGGRWWSSVKPWRYSRMNSMIRA